jgi:hypothetical protein
MNKVRLKQKINQKIRDGFVKYGDHTYDELEQDNFTSNDLDFALQNYDVNIEFTHDVTHNRYELIGSTEDNRAMGIVIMFRGDFLFVKTVYEL